MVSDQKSASLDFRINDISVWTTLKPLILETIQFYRNSFDGVSGEPTDYNAKAQGVRRAYDIARRNCIIDLQIRADVRLGRTEEENIRTYQEVVKALPRDPTLKIAFEPERGPEDGILNLAADRLAKDGTAIYRDRNSLL